MQKFIVWAFVASAAIVPSIGHAQWVVEYHNATEWWKKYPSHASGTWLEASWSNVKNNLLNTDTEQVGSTYYPQNNINFYHEAGTRGAVEVTVIWNGDPANEPANVHLRLTTSGHAYYNYARSPGILTLNDGFGGSGTQSYYQTSDGSWSGSGTATYTEDLYLATGGSALVYDSTIVMLEASHAQLDWESETDLSGNLGINVGASWDVTMQALP